MGDSSKGLSDVEKMKGSSDVEKMGTPFRMAVGTYSLCVIYFSLGE